jgi:FkbM family methyltransferase
MSSETRVIFDLGFNNGDDTAHYLSRGFSVIAVDANPHLVERGRERFATQIADGRLRLLNIGIADHAGTADFYINHQSNAESSFIPEVGQRGGAYSVVNVPTTTLSALFKEFGTPYYCKIDVEGHEWICLRDLTATPLYVSVEAHRLEYLALLYSKGYRQFKVVNQQYHAGFPNGSAGPISDTISDWDTLETVAYDWLHTRLGRPERSSLDFGWYDFHAKLGGDELAGGYAKPPMHFRSTRQRYWIIRTKLGATRIGRALKSVVR